MELKIGCTGWSYQGWAGTFYPKAMESTAYLRHYSKIFDVTEINSTFYRIPTQSMTNKWLCDTPNDFIFTAKIPKVITHDGRLKPGPYLDQFLNSIKPLKAKMKVLVIQLPPSLSFAEARPHLEKMARHLPSDYRYAVEGRHPSWFGDPACKFLSECNLCLVWNEVDGVTNPALVTTDFVYLRLIGDRSIPEKEFGRLHRDKSDVIQKWADNLDKIKNKVSLGMIMANNHLEGFGPATANKLRLALGLKPVSWSDASQKPLSDFAP